MNSPASMPEPDPEIRAIEQRAAEWFGRCEVGLTPAEEREFLRWLESDVRHGEAMREMDDTWDMLDGLKDLDRAWVARRTVAEVDARPTAASRRRVAWPVALAAAAGLAFAAVGVWQPWREVPVHRQAVTEAGGMKKLDLPDGSTVHLNASSGVEAHFTRAVRRVALLRGEAHFVVAPDAARPFIVTVGHVAVRAVGTAFNIRRNEQEIEVFVTEGKVRIDDADRGQSLLVPAASADIGSPSDGTPEPANPGLLVAGQRVLVHLGAAVDPVQSVVVAPIAPEEIREALAWRARQLDFDLTPLDDVVAEFNRYNSHQLVIADPELGRQPFGGSFHADNYRVFVQLLERRFGVIAERGEDKTLLRRAR